MEEGVLLLGTEDILKVLKALGVEYKSSKMIQRYAKGRDEMKLPGGSGGFAFIDASGKYLGAYNFTRYIYHNKTGKDLTWSQYAKAIEESNIIEQ